MTTPYMHLLNCVLAREGTVDRAHWPTTCSLKDVVNTFNLVGEEIASHDKRRQVVSRAWMMYLLHDAIHRWMCGLFHKKHLPSNKVDVTRPFARNTVIPMLEVKPKVTIRSYELGNKHAMYLKKLESSQYGSLVPFSIDAFSVGTFGDMTSDEMTEVLRLVEGPMKKTCVPPALKAYFAGERPNAGDAEGKINKVDIYYAPGKRVTAVRDSDNFVDISSIFTVSGRCYKTYKRAKGTSAFLSSFTCASNKTLICDPAESSLDSYWAHYKVAIHVAEYCEASYDLAALLAYLPDDTLPATDKCVHQMGPNESNTEVEVHENVELCELCGQSKVMEGAHGAAELPVEVTSHIVVTNEDHVVVDKELEEDAILTVADASFCIRVRPGDGFLDATQMCRNARKKWTNFFTTGRVQVFLQELAKRLHVPIEDLWSSTIGRGGGTWVHPALATRLALWISEIFGVSASLWLEGQKMSDKAVAEEYIVALSNLEPTSSNQYEAEVRARLAAELGGEQSVVGKFGEIDLVTSSEVIEIKYVKKWTHALGQVLAHAKSMPDKSPRVHFFGFVEEFADGILDHIKLLYDDYNIRISHEVLLV